MSDYRRCRKKLANGKQCRKRTARASGFCWLHDEVDTSIGSQTHVPIPSSWDDAAWDTAGKAATVGGVLSLIELIYKYISIGFAQATHRDAAEIDLQKLKRTNLRKLERIRKLAAENVIEAEMRMRDWWDAQSPAVRKRLERLVPDHWRDDSQ